MNDIFSWIGLGILAWGTYLGWQKLSASDNEWINTKEPLNIVVKIAMSILSGTVVAVVQLVKLGLRLAIGIIGG